MITIVLLRTEKGSNLGLIVRAMKNFGLNNLVLIDSKVKKTSKDAVRYSKHALDILKKAKIKNSQYLKRFDYLIGTTAMLGTDYNIPRSPLTPEQLCSKKEIYPKKSKIAILFGPEGHGLSNKEINLCDFIVSIPSSKKYPTLNISNAASIIFYEIFKNQKTENIISHINLATQVEKKIALKKINQILNNMEFSTKQKKQTQKTLWKRIIGKSFLTKRESYALIGFWKKVNGLIKK